MMNNPQGPQSDYREVGGGWGQPSGNRFMYKEKKILWSKGKLWGGFGFEKDYFCRRDNLRWRENWFLELKLALETGFHADIGYHADWKNL